MALSKTQVIKQYFGLRPDSSLSDFIQEMKALSKEETLELAQLAAAEVHLGQGGCDFPLDN